MSLMRRVVTRPLLRLAEQLALRAASLRAMSYPNRQGRVGAVGLTMRARWFLTRQA